MMAELFFIGLTILGVFYIVFWSSGDKKTIGFTNKTGKKNNGV